MPWYPRRPLSDDLRDMALAALEYGLEVYLADEGDSLKLWVGHPDLRVYQAVSAPDQVDAFVTKWVRGLSAEG
jgi:hypothetical protein